jgi:hypothetical protein
LLQQKVLDSKAVQTDDTPVPVLDPDLPRNSGFLAGKPTGFEGALNVQLSFRSHWGPKAADVKGWRES